MPLPPYHDHLQAVDWGPHPFASAAVAKGAFLAPFVAEELGKVLVKGQSFEFAFLVTACFGEPQPAMHHLAYRIVGTRHRATEKKASLGQQGAEAEA
jgi:hypothetical protein